MKLKPGFSSKLHGAWQPTHLAAISMRTPQISDFQPECYSWGGLSQGKEEVNITSKALQTVHCYKLAALTEQ